MGRGKQAPYIYSIITPAFDKETSFRYAAGEVLHFITSVEESCIHHMQKDYMLAYFYSGELTIHDDTDERSFAAGSCAFIRKNHHIRALRLKDGLQLNKYESPAKWFPYLALLEGTFIVY